MKAPFPWFGGKSRAADLIWDRLGVVDNYVEPFFGSGAVLLASTSIARTETVNDKDGLVANFWRSVALSPDETARYADWPVNENDLHARHSWLIAQIEDLVPRLEGDPEYHDPKIAGWWVWGLCSWIGSGWCSGRGPWVVEDGRMVLGNQGQGVNRQLPHLGNQGRGVNRKLPHLGNQGRGVNRKVGIYGYFADLSDRLRRVRVCCGDWRRVLGPSVTTKLGLTGIMLDPPYDPGERESDLYRCDGSMASEVRDWCQEHGKDPLMRIALCGYDVEHVSLEEHGWSVVSWVASGAYSSGKGGPSDVNRRRERIWFSPACLGHRQGGLFD